MMEREMDNQELVRKLFHVFIHGLFNPTDARSRAKNGDIAKQTSALAEALGIRRDFEALLIHHYDQAKAQIDEEDNE